MSDLVQRKIALTAKQLICDQSLEKLSVTAIMRTAGLRRQTFYDYFKDKYDLLAWLYKVEVTEVVADDLSYEHWSDALHQVCVYFFENQDFYRKILANHAQNAPMLAIQAHTRQLVAQVIQNLMQIKAVFIESRYRQFLIDFLTNGLVCEIKAWLLQPTPIPVAEEFKDIQCFVEDTFNGLLLRTRQPRTYEHQRLSV